MAQILLLEDDSDLGSYFKDLLEMNGSPAVVAESVDELVSRRNEVFECETAFLDIDLGRNRPTGVDAYKWLVQENFTGRVFFLTAHARNSPLVSDALSIGNGNVEVLSKPISPQNLLKLAGAH
jgi:CheY-like chemotaxis protein